MAPAEISKDIYPLLMKIWMRTSEPLRFKDGTQHAVWKRKGSHNIRESYEAIVVTSVIGNLSHSLLRKASIAEMAASGNSLQILGLPRFSPTFGWHLVRLFQSAAGAGNYSRIFLDLREAFYRGAQPCLVSFRQLL